MLVIKESSSFFKLKLDHFTPKRDFWLTIKIFISFIQANFNLNQINSSILNILLAF